MQAQSDQCPSQHPSRGRSDDGGTQGVAGGLPHHGAQQASAVQRRGRNSVEDGRQDDARQPGRRLHRQTNTEGPRENAGRRSEDHAHDKTDQRAHPGDPELRARTGRLAFQTCRAADRTGRQAQGASPVAFITVAAIQPDGSPQVSPSVVVQPPTRGTHTLRPGTGKNQAEFNPASVLRTPSLEEAMVIEPPLPVPPRPQPGPPGRPDPAPGPPTPRPVPEPPPGPSPRPFPVPQPPEPAPRSRRSFSGPAPLHSWDVNHRRETLRDHAMKG